VWGLGVLRHAEHRQILAGLRAGLRGRAVGARGVEAIMYVRSHKETTSHGGGRLAPWCTVRNGTAVTIGEGRQERGGCEQGREPTALH
jgi:hypothetical protein